MSNPMIYFKVPSGSISFDTAIEKYTDYIIAETIVGIRNKDEYYLKNFQEWLDGYSTEPLSE